MTTSSKFDLINGKAFTIGPKAPVPSSPVSSFNRAINTISYKSYDNKQLSTGMPVYQIQFLPEEKKINLKKFLIIELISDGRIKVQENSSVNTSIFRPEQIYVSPESLVKDWITALKYQISVELPNMISNLVNIMKTFDPNFNIDTIQVGLGMDEEEI